LEHDEVKVKAVMGLPITWRSYFDAVVVVEVIVKSLLPL
jgi:hypothetical protein